MKRHLFEGLPDDQASDKIAARRKMAGIDDIDWLMDKYPGDSEEHWTKEKGFGYVYDEYGDKRRVELHWYQSPSNGRVEMKIKVQPGGEIYLDD